MNKEGSLEEEGKGRGRHRTGAQHWTTRDFSRDGRWPLAPDWRRGWSRCREGSLEALTVPELRRRLGCPPWLPTWQEESASQLSPRAPSATRQPDGNLVFRGVTLEFSALSGQ